MASVPAPLEARPGTPRAEFEQNCNPPGSDDDPRWSDLHAAYCLLSTVDDHR